MRAVDTDVMVLENAIRGFIQILKRPQHWSHVVSRSGVQLDRPAAIILQTLLAQQPATLHPQELAQHLGIEPPSVTRHTQRLEAVGYLRRQADKRDRRVTRLYVTPAGKRVAEKIWQAQRSLIYEALSTWPAQQRHQFVNLFERFTNDLTLVSNPSNQPKERTAHV